jgi:hypothetical protein
MRSVVRNREEEAERLADEVSENRDDLDRLLESFRRRERELLDDVESLRHKHGTLADLLQLVTERAESTQKELDRCRAAGSDVILAAPGDITSGSSATAADAALQKDWEVSMECGLKTVVLDGSELTNCMQTSKLTGEMKQKSSSQRKL